MYHSGGDPHLPVDWSSVCKKNILEMEILLVLQHPYHPRIDTWIHPNTTPIHYIIHPNTRAVHAYYYPLVHLYYRPPHHYCLPTP